ncbi:MAG TPA: hypothetical protein VH370_17055 [Humisphaera sp.]|nr:hypothetical protein [Humisphaera sp.]
MPVRIEATQLPRHGPLTLEATGALPTEIAISNQSDLIVPWLAISDSLAQPRLTIDGAGGPPIGARLHLLEDDQRLIGFAGADSDALRPFFQNQKIVGVALNLAQPLAGPICAWETLDGIVLDSSAAARVTERQLAGILSAGTAVAIRSSTKPAGQWPWKKVGDYWMLHHAVAGPDTAYEPTVYLPTSAWARGWPASVRRQILLAAVIFSILSLGAVLPRWRGAVLLVLLVCGLTIGGAVAWRHHLSARLETGGSIIVRRDNITQRDMWTYRGAIRPADDRMNCQQLTRPVLGYRRQVEETHLRLICHSDGSPSHFEYHLEPAQSLAFLSRKVVIGRDKTPPLATMTSPLRELADKLYATRELRLAGEAPASDPSEDIWPTVIVDNVQ